MKPLHLACVGLILAALAGEARPLTVLTWNTMHYGWDRQAEELKRNRTQAMIEALRTSGADIVLIQETYGCYDRFLKGLTGWHGALLGSCNSVYSRYPIVKTYEPYDDGLMYGTTNGYNYGTSTKPFTFAVAEIDVERYSLFPSNHGFVLTRFELEDGTERVPEQSKGLLRFFRF